MFEGKLLIRFRLSEDKYETINGEFHSIVEFSENCNMICMKVGKVLRMFPLANVISIDVPKLKKEDDDPEESDVMII